MLSDFADCRFGSGDPDPDSVPMMRLRGWCDCCIDPAASSSDRPQTALSWCFIYSYWYRRPSHSHRVGYEDELPFMDLVYFSWLL